MKKELTSVILALIVAFLAVGCEVLDKCDGVMCSTGPPQFSILLLDKETGENVFASGRYKTSDVSVIDSDGNSIYSLVIGEDDYIDVRIALPSKEEDISVNLHLNANTTISIDAYVREGKSKCCTNYFAEDVTPSSHEFERESGSLIIKI